MTGRWAGPPGTIVLDVDGTLVDTNYHHALAWYRAFRDNGVVLRLWRLHRHMGMGGDQLVAAVAGDRIERRCGDDIRAREATCYGELIDEVSLLPGAVELLEGLQSRGWTSVLDSSAKPSELDHYLDLLEARSRVDAWTSSADAQSAKPRPDLIHAALAKVGSSSGLMVGDSVFDCEASVPGGNRLGLSPDWWLFPGGTDRSRCPSGVLGTG